VRSYEIRDGVAYLKHMASKTDTRIVGITELNIDYDNYHEQTEAEDSVAEVRGR
ncbi:MAG: hypothetical protein H7039_23000, partial [Bryobacteraceae bacterium]|nr:hypothetical protein [Bryobacteraceae bacterium]